ncbi:uncharacterized protein LOC134006122 [Scomber scombrus]|uniref:uncharacterized protein LOC134006122 n=1 Tax=Scomber scombrus TaxID=13677 RepID=UPI002DD7DDF7|nr:uncharacterized protein LOC134006122 [Scomber scombrus]
MAASVITVLFLFSCLLQSASTDHQIKEIKVHHGQTVTLPCKAPNNINIASVEWIRSNLDRYVYLKEDGRLMTADQDPSYVNRVQLRDDEMKNGELSLILKNVNNNDEGAYECRYEERGSWETGDQIKLIVLDAGELQRLQQITAHRGQTVTLPCRDPNYVIITAVQWVRSNLDRYVYLKTDGHMVTADQDPSYVNRVQLRDDEMKNGDLSLILKNVKSRDEGKYECRYEERGSWKRGDQIKLTVILDAGDLLRQPIKVHHGQTVTLSCRAPSNVPIAAVEWIRSNLQRHVYLKEDGYLNTANQDPSYVNRVQLRDDEMKNGELSLILRNVNSNDEGTYECRYLEMGEGCWETGDRIKLIVLNVRDGDAEDGKHSGRDDLSVIVPDLYMHGHLGVILPVTLIVSGLVGFVIYKKLKGR